MSTILPFEPKARGTDTPVQQDVFFSSGMTVKIPLPGAGAPADLEGAFLKDGEAGFFAEWERANRDENVLCLRTSEDVNGEIREIMVDAKFYGDEIRQAALPIFRDISGALRKSLPLEKVMAGAYQNAEGAMREVIALVTTELRKHYGFSNNKLLNSRFFPQ